MHQITHQYLIKVDLTTIMQSIKSQFSFISSKKVLYTQPVHDSIIADCPRVLKGILDKLGLSSYFPQKLKYEDVITLTEDVLHGTDRKPKTLSDLPWYFMKQIIGIDSSVRENCYVDLPHEMKRYNICVAKTKKVKIVMTILVAMMKTVKVKILITTTNKMAI